MRCLLVGGLPFLRPARPAEHSTLGGSPLLKEPEIPQSVRDFPALDLDPSFPAALTGRRRVKLDSIPHSFGLPTTHPHREQLEGGTIFTTDATHKLGNRLGGWLSTQTEPKQSGQGDA
jgi:hypothetical protein